MKKRYYLLIFLSCLSLVAFLSNRYLYIHRFEGYLYTEALNINQFYDVNESCRIQSFEKKNAHQLLIKVLPVNNNARWIIIDSAKNSIPESGPFPTISLKEGTHFYEFYNQTSPDTIKLEVELDKDNSVSVPLSNIPLIEEELIPLSKWTELPHSVSQKEIEDTKKIIRDSIPIYPSDNTVTRIIKVGVFLLKELKPHLGAPLDSIKHLTPLNQFKLAVEKNYDIDCADYADIYFLFANCADIPTRRIGVAGWMGDIPISGHVFDESYVPEQQRWAFVDLTSEKITVTNAADKVLNTADLIMANAEGLITGLKVLTLKNNKPALVNYETMNLSEMEYLKPTANLYYIKNDINENMSFKESFKEYLSRQSHYGVYYSNTIIVDNSKHYFKMYVFYTSLVIWFAWLSLLLVLGISFLFRVFLKFSKSN